MKILLALLIFFSLTTTSQAKQEKQNDYSEYYVQLSELLDCQTISIDETFLPNEKKSESTVCFWKIKISTRDLIYWKEIGSNNYGFIR